MAVLAVVLMILEYSRRYAGLAVVRSGLGRLPSCPTMVFRPRLPFYNEAMQINKGYVR